VKLEKKES